MNIEGLSASQVPEMIIRTQAALRALSALEEEISRQTAELNAIQEVGQRSEAISKLTQSRAASSLQVTRNRISPLPRGSVDRAPSSPLAEITNTVSRPFRTEGAHPQSLASSPSQSAVERGVRTVANVFVNPPPQLSRSRIKSFQSRTSLCSTMQFQEKENRSTLNATVCDSTTCDGSNMEDTGVIPQLSCKRSKDQDVNLRTTVKKDTAAETQKNSGCSKHTGSLQNNLKSGVDGEGSQSPNIRRNEKKLRVAIGVDIQTQLPVETLPADIEKSVNVPILDWNSKTNSKGMKLGPFPVNQDIPSLPFETDFFGTPKVLDANGLPQTLGHCDALCVKCPDVEAKKLGCEIKLPKAGPAVQTTADKKNSELDILSVSLQDVWDAGISLSVGNDGIFEVSTIIPSSPAQREGIAVGDLVFEAGYRELRGLNADEVNRILIGSLGSTINLVVWRYGHSSPCRVSLVREILASTVTAHLDECNRARIACTSCQMTSVEASDAEPAIASCAPKACVSCSNSDRLEWRAKDRHQNDKIITAIQCTHRTVISGNHESSLHSLSSDDSKEMSIQDVEDDDWILSWSVEDVCSYFRTLRLQGEGIAEAAERALLVERYLIDGTILCRAMNHGDGENWLANTLALTQQKILELKELLSKPQLSRERPNICNGPRSHHNLQSVCSQSFDLVGSKRPAIFNYNDFYRCSQSALKYEYHGSDTKSSLSSDLNLSSKEQCLSTCCYELKESTRLGADVSRRRVREWSPSDVLAFLRDLVPYSSVKDTEFRNENIRRYNVCGKTLLELYLDNDEFLQSKLLLMPAQAARARNILKSYSTQNGVPFTAVHSPRTFATAQNSKSTIMSTCSLGSASALGVDSKGELQVRANRLGDGMKNLNSEISKQSEHHGIFNKIQVDKKDLINANYEADFQDAESWYAAAVACRCDLGDRETQYEILQKALLCNNKHVNSLCDCGVLMQEAFKNFDLARIYYERALASNPNHIISLCNCAILYAQELNNPKRAKDLYEKALEVDPKNIFAMHSLATLLSDFSGDFEGAKVLYEQVLQQDPDYVPTLCNYGALLDSVYGDYERCIEIYEHALRICPNHSLTLCNFGALLNDVKKDYSASEVLFCKSLQADPTHVSTLCNYGWLQMDGLNNPMAAWALFERALALEPTHAQTLFNYGCLLEKHSIYNGAEEMYKKAIEFNPGLTSCRRQYASFLVSIRNDSLAAASILRDMTGAGTAVTSVTI